MSKNLQQIKAILYGDGGERGDCTVATAHTAPDPVPELVAQLALQLCLATISMGFEVLRELSERRIG